MTRTLNRLTAKAVTTRRKPGAHSGGGNLYLKVTKTGKTLSRSFVFMFMYAGRQREAGLGSTKAISLDAARSKAAEYRALLAKGTDPLADKKAAREASAERRTFGQCAGKLLESNAGSWRNEKHRAQWRSTLDNYCKPLLDMSVDSIDTPAVLGVLQPVWQRI